MELTGVIPGYESFVSHHSLSSTRNNCGKKGHWESECDLKCVEEQIAQLQLRASKMRRSKQANLSKNFEEHSNHHGGESNKSSDEVNLTEHKNLPKWFYNSRALNHFTEDKSTLVNYVPSSSLPVFPQPVGPGKPSSARPQLSLEINKSVCNVVYVSIV